MSRGRRVMITELLILFMMMVFVTVVITQALVVSRNRSLEARELTEAVILAENTAEAASASDSMRELESTMAGLYEGSAVDASSKDGENGEIIIRNCSLANHHDTGNAYDIVVSRSITATKGVLIEDVISIYPSGTAANGNGSDSSSGNAGYVGAGEPVFTLDTAHFVREEAGNGS